MRIEIAIRAFAHAPGHVHVQQREARAGSTHARASSWRAQRAQRLCRGGCARFFSSGASSRRGHPEIGQPKIGVVSKAARAARRIENESLPNPFGQSAVPHPAGPRRTPARSGSARAAPPSARRRARPAASRYSRHHRRRRRRSGPNGFRARRRARPLRDPSRPRLPPRRSRAPRAAPSAARSTGRSIRSLPAAPPRAPTD